MINLQFAQSMIPNKKALYDACIINKFRMPDLKTSLCTNEYLLGLKDRKCYTPYLHQIVYTPCANPPPVPALHKMLINVIESNFG